MLVKENDRVKITTAPDGTCTLVVKVRLFEYAYSSLTDCAII